MKRSNDTATNDIARLRGARFVTTAETEQGKRLPEHLIKQVTGNDPFTARFPEEKMDRYLDGKLFEERSGIFNWLIEGALRWKAEGMRTPAIITNATDKYRGEMDVIGNFIRERCVQQLGLSIRARELFHAYQEWCAENNEQATSERMFGVRMKELGMAQKRTAEARYWEGMGFPPAPLRLG